MVGAACPSRPCRRKSGSSADSPSAKKSACLQLDAVATRLVLRDWIFFRQCLTIDLFRLNPICRIDSMDLSGTHKGVFDMSQQSLNRREFLSHSAGVAASVPLAAVARRVHGANEKLRIGMIGTGSRGRNAHMKDIYRFSEKENVEITALCDPWDENRQQAAAMVKEWWGRDPMETTRFEELLALDDVDAVVVACPDHQHARVLKASAEAQKDIYQEKPIAMTLDELKEAVDAVKKNNVIVQVGTQLRSWGSFTAVKNLVRAGEIGPVCKTEQVRNGLEPYWNRYAERPVTKDGVDWKAFLMHRAYRPFDADQFAGWYGYRDFSSGPIGGFMSHYIDLVHYITGAKFPHRSVTMGGIYVYKNQRTCPDSVQTILEYPEGFLVSYSTMFGNGSGSYTRFFGTEGMVDMSDWNKPFITTKGTHDADRIKGEKPIEAVEMPHHMENWLQCLRTREQPNADIDAGYQHGVAVILSDRAYVTGKTMIYDAAKREIREA